MLKVAIVGAIGAVASVQRPPLGEFTYFYGMNDTLSQSFSAKDLYKVYTSFGKEVKMNLHPFVKGSIDNLTCSHEVSPCTQEQTAMCAIAVAQSDDQGSEFPGQEAIVQWHFCLAVQGSEAIDECYTAAKINKSKVDECLTTPNRVQVLILENLMVAQDVGAPPFVRVDNSSSVPEYDHIKTQLCSKHPTLSACSGPAPTPPPTPPPPPPTPAPTPVPSGHYGRPPCRDDEDELDIQGEGAVCGSQCDFASCPRDVPSGTRYYPECILRTTTGESYCGIPCNYDSDCGGSAVCSWQVGVCEYEQSAENGKQVVKIANGVAFTSV